MKRDKYLNFRKLILRKSNFLALICLLAYLPSQAELVIRAGLTPFSEYAAWVATHPEDRSWIHNLESQHPSKAEASTLTDLVEATQKLFLTGSLDEAKVKFRDIADLANSNDWRASEREAITYSMLRYFQLEKSHARWTYLKYAAVFGFDVHFNPRIFPPPIIKSWRDEISKARKKSVQISNLKDFKGFDILKVDGRSYSFADSEFISILPGEHRISFLGSQAQYFAQKIGSNQLQVMKVEPVILVSGTCENPKVSSEIHFAFTAIFEETCVRSYSGQAWLAPLSAQRAAQLGKLDLQSASFKNSESQFSRDVTSTVVPSPHTWLWAGVGAAVLTSLALVYQNNQSSFGGSSNSSRVRAVHKQGN